MTTTVTKTIKSSGGDYSSRAAWEAGQQGDLTSSDTIQKAEVYAFTDTSTYTIDGWTTDATRYVWIFIPATERHSGKWDDAKANNSYTATSTYSRTVVVSEDFVKIEGDQIKITVNGYTSCGAISFGSGLTSSSKVVFDKCLIRAVSGGTAMAGGVYSSNVNANFIFAACIFYDFDQFRVAYLRDGHASAKFYSCTFQNCASGVDTLYQDNKTILKNCLFKSVTTAATGTFAAGTDYNATNNSTLNYTVTGGGNTHDRLSQTFTFVDEANDDFHLASGDTGATGYGVDLSGDSSYAFNYDIDDQTISGAWSIGADKYIAAGGSTGTIAVTFGDIAAALSGTTTVTGSASPTLASTTAALTGTPTIIGSIAQVLAATTAALSGTTTVLGTISNTFANVVASLSGAVGSAVSGTISSTLANISAALTGTTTVTGAINATLAAVTATLTGTITIIGTIAATTANVVAYLYQQAASGLSSWWGRIRRRRR